MKHTKNILPAAACAAILLFVFQTSGAGDIPASERRPWDEVPETVRAEWIAILKNVGEKGRAAFPELAMAMDNSDLGSWYLKKAFTRIVWVDGWDIHARGNPHLLASARGILHRLLDYDKRYEFDTVWRGLIYLAHKGDAQDFPLFEKYRADPILLKFMSENPFNTLKDEQERESRLAMPYSILQHRVAGTNIVRGVFAGNLYPYFNISLEYDEYSYSTNALRFIPSVANTGPQAAYVYDALKQAHALGRRLGCDSPFSSITNIAPELLTMRVWFDADGNAVCDVDLAKYGISVPGLSTATNAPPPLEPPQQERPPPVAATSVRTITAVTAEPSTAPPARPCPVGIAVIVAGILAAVLALLAVFWKKRLKQ